MKQEGILVTVILSRFLFFLPGKQQQHALCCWVSWLQPSFSHSELAWWLSNPATRATFVLCPLPSQESLQATYFSAAVSLHWKASLYEELKYNVSFQSAETMPGHIAVCQPASGGGLTLSLSPKRLSTLTKHRIAFRPVDLFSVFLHPILKSCWCKNHCLQLMSFGSTSLTLLVLPLFIPGVLDLCACGFQHFTSFSCLKGPKSWLLTKPADLKTSQHNDFIMV